MRSGEIFIFFTNFNTNRTKPYIFNHSHSFVMKKVFIFIAALLALVGCSSPVVRQDTLLEKGWKFTREDGEFSGINVADENWQDVNVPHDWAIYGPFDANNDAQVVAITQNFETMASLKTGRTGGLPYVGVGWYRTIFEIPDFDSDKHAELLFDGAMSDAKVYVNG